MELRNHAPSTTWWDDNPRHNHPRRQPALRAETLPRSPTPHVPPSFPCTELQSISSPWLGHGAQPGLGPELGLGTRDVMEDAVPASDSWASPSTCTLLLPALPSHFPFKQCPHSSSEKKGRERSGALL